MMFDGRILQEMFEDIEKRHGKAAWMRLSRLKTTFLTEWELYMAYVMKYHREVVAFRPLPYVNWGRLDSVLLRIVSEQKDVYYLTKHDNWQEENICCVNSNWTDSHPVGCPCCARRTCGRIKIDCNTIGLEKCWDTADGLMIFNTVYEESSLV
jgi:hypothetical protein